MVIIKASAIGVSPTFLEISQQQPITHLTLTNEQNTAITMQLETVKWSQMKGQEIYTPTDAVIATPQIFTIPAHGKQIVRLGMITPLFGKQEKSYRLFVQEVVPNAITKKKIMLKIALRMSIPVKLAAISAIHQHIEWQIKDQKGNTSNLSAHNKGNNILFINLLQGYSAKGQAVTQPVNTFAYLLPGSQKTWTVKKSSVIKLSQIKATINRKVIFTNVS